MKSFKIEVTSTLKDGSTQVENPHLISNLLFKELMKIKKEIEAELKARKKIGARK